ncbi:hypothetical protein GCM10011309_01750 [Litorimonas cladophorae]|uniref:Uncharacterized protein n=1 Tax=Litorimonas cladophorae TaxID=1220491 RepID=A0A918NBW7_9PROT|nr:hypothetical protein [Litorimonas cladophorae]GGX56574.1 hypothetical protein GCM10011309_01750 [Litorimonas cladophorae]
MKTLLKTAAIAALITGFANAAQAGTPHAFQTDAELAMIDMAPTLNPQNGSAEIRQAALIEREKLSAKSRIAVARLDGGRFIPTPHNEEADWSFLSKRMDVNLEMLTAGDHFKYIPEIAFDGIDTDNKIDEIRLTAANEGYSHVILYGMDADAYWSSFGGKALSETGLTVHEDCNSWDKAKAKALLVDAHTGEVLGAAKTDDVTFNIGYLADDMERVLNALT